MTGGRTSPAGRVFLAKGRDRSVRRFHPWIFSGAVAKAEGDPSPGALVEVMSSEGELLGLGQWSPASQIRVRMVAFGENPRFSCRERVAAAIERRRPILVPGRTDAARLVNAESDGLPGVIADIYAGWVVCQFNSAGAAAAADEIADAIREAVSPEGIVERSDSSVLRLEGLEPRERRISGGEVPERLRIVENGVSFFVDIRRGHKTGFYLDQRDARRTVGAFANGADVLNCFSYTGGFGLFARQCGALSVVQVDASAEALALAKRNEGLTHLCGTTMTYEEADVFQYLRACRDRGRTFDLVVLDPPKFASVRSQVAKAARGYKDINLLAMKLLRPNGVLATFSCSGAMTPAFFDTVLAEAAEDAKRDFQVVARTCQAEDHPVALSFPEGAYLKGVILRALQ